MKTKRLIKLANGIEKVEGLEKLRKLEDVRSYLLSIEGIGRDSRCNSTLALNLPTVSISKFV